MNRSSPLQIEAVEDQRERGQELDGAVRRRDRKAMLRLLAKGMDRECLDEALGVAAELAPPAMVRDLLAAGANPEFRDYFGSTALMRAAGRRHARVMRILLEHGAVVNAASDPGPGGSPGLLHTPLMLAAMSGDLRSLLLLLRAGADPQAADSSGLTALHWAAYWAAPLPVLRTLLDRGVPVDPLDVWGRTPLMLAVWQGALEVAEFLVSSGARLDMRDFEGYSAWMWAVKWGHAAVAEMLAKRGAHLETQPFFVVPEEYRHTLRQK